MRPCMLWKSLPSLRHAGAASAKSTRYVCIAHSQFHAKSAGPKWFGMPAFGGASYKTSSKKAQTQGGKSSFTGGDAREATEKELRQQIQAIRLRNALDPKRFYRGSAGTGAERGMPAYAQLGRIVGGGLEPSSILNRSQRSETVVGELVRDSQSVSYSKRKFDEVCNHRSRRSFSDAERRPPGRNGAPPAASGAITHRASTSVFGHVA